MRTWSKGAWIAIACLAALSAFLNFTALRETRHGDLVIADGAKYVAYAYNLAHHHTFSHTKAYGDARDAVVSPDKLTLPGYPAFLSLFLGEGPPDAAFVQRVLAAQACLNIASTLLAFLIALRLMPLGWAFVAGLLAASVPHAIVIAGYPLTEALSTTLVLAFVLAALCAAAPGGTRWQAVLAGLLLGLLCLVRPQLQGIPWLVLLAVAFVPKWRPHLRNAALAAAVFAAVVLPWQIRNAQVARAPADADLMVLTVYHGSFPNFMYRDIPETRGYAYSFDPYYEERVRDMPTVLAYVRGLFAEHPARYARWYLLGKPGAFLSWDFVEGRGGIFIYPATSSPWLENPLFVALRNLHAWLHWPLMGAAMLTVFLVFWRPEWIVRDEALRTDVRLVSSLIAYVVLLHMLGYPLPRYNLPYRPLELMMALVGLRALLKVRRAKAHPAQD